MNLDFIKLMEDNNFSLAFEIYPVEATKHWQDYHIETTENNKKRVDEGVSCDANNAYTLKKKHYRYNLIQKSILAKNKRFIFLSTHKFFKLKDKKGNWVGYIINQKRRSWKNLKVNKKQWQAKSNKTQKDWWNKIPNYQLFGNIAIKKSLLLRLIEDNTLSEIQDLLKLEIFNNIGEFGFKFLSDVIIFENDQYGFYFETINYGVFIELDYKLLENKCEIGFHKKGYGEISEEFTQYCTPYRFKYNINKSEFAKHYENFLQLKLHKTLGVCYKPENCHWYSVKARYLDEDTLKYIKNKEIKTI